MSDTFVRRRRPIFDEDEPSEPVVHQHVDQQQKTSLVNRSERAHWSSPLPRPISQNYRERFPTLVFDTPVEIRKPNATEFFRLHPDPAYRCKLRLLHMKEESEFYIVDKPLHAELISELQVFELATCISRAGTAFLWPVRLFDRRGQSDSWVRAMRQTLETAEKHWVRMVSRPGKSGYEIRMAKFESSRS